MIKDILFEILQDYFRTDNIQLGDPDPDDFVRRFSIIARGRTLKTCWIDLSDEEMLKTYSGITAGSELFAIICGEVGRELDYWEYNHGRVSTEECSFPMYIDKTGKPAGDPNWRKHPKWPEGL